MSEKFKRLKISPTMINDCKRCKYKVWHRLMKTPQVANDAANRGTTIHEYHDRIWLDVELNELLELDPTTWHRDDEVHRFFASKGGDPPKDILAKKIWWNLIEHLSRQFHLFYRTWGRRNLKYFIPIAVEKMLYSKDGQKGKPDAVYKLPNGRYMVEDLKTGKPPRSLPKWSTAYAFQLAYYAKLIADNKKFFPGARPFDVRLRITYLGGDEPIASDKDRMHPRTWTSIQPKTDETLAVAEEFLSCKSFEEAATLFAPNVDECVMCFYEPNCEIGKRVRLERKRQQEEFVQQLARLETEVDKRRRGSDFLSDMR